MAEITKSRGAKEIHALILLSAPDSPGLAKGLFEALAPFAITILDVQQMVIHGRLILSVLIALNPAHAKAIEIDLVSQAEILGVDIAVAFTDSPEDTAQNLGQLLHIYLLGEPFTPTMLLDITQAIGDMTANIEAISLEPSATPVLHIIISGVTLDEARSTLSDLARTHMYELAVTTSAFLNARKLFVLDVDSTLIEQEVIELLARRAGVEDQVKAITDSAMRGELDFSESLIARVSLLKGLPVSVISDVQSEIVLTQGAEILIESLNKLGHVVGLVTGGFREVISPIVAQLGIKHVEANGLEIKDGVFTGLVGGPIVDRARKAEALIEFAAQESISVSHTIAIGDGANDLDMVMQAHLGIAFCAKPALNARADTIIARRDLSRVLDLLGIPRIQKLL